MQALNEYFRELIAQRRRAPHDDLISALIANEAEDTDRLDEAEIIANCMLLLSAGHETTTNVLGNGLLALLRHPDQLRLLRETPTLILSGVEEFLRYDSAVQLAPRIVVETIEVAGRTLQSGESVMFLLAAGNRDPEHFTDPDRFDIAREPNDHLAFGFDRHFCLGAHLARAEAQIAVTAILTRFSSLALADDAVEWQPNPAYRGVKKLQLVW